MQHAFGARSAARVAAPYVCLLGVCAVASVPLLVDGVPLDGHDAHAHVRWQRAFAEQLWRGDGWPRWLSSLNDGMGSPAFFVYPPVGHLVAALAWPGLPAPVDVPLRLAWGAFAASCLGAIGALRWLLHLAPTRAAAVACAALYVLAPYPLIVDGQLRVAYAELWAFAWAPWTLAALHDVGEQPRRGVVGVSVATALLIASHLPSTMMLLPAFGAYAAAVAGERRDARVLARGLVALLLGGALAAAYWMPARAHAAHLDDGALFGRYFDSGRWLFFAATAWPNEDARRVVGEAALVQCILATTFVVPALVVRPVRRYAALLAVGALAVSFLTTTWSEPVWSTLAPLRRVQFPWRLLTVHTLACAGLVACALRAPGGRAVVPFAVVVVGLVAIADVRLSRVVARRQRATSIEFVYASTTDVPEFRRGDGARAAASFPRGGVAEVRVGEATVREAQTTARRVVLDVVARSDAIVAVRRWSYPGWVARVDDAPATTATGRYGEIEVRVPPGQHRVVVELPRGTDEVVGGVLSTTTAIALFCGVVFRRRRSSRMGAVLLDAPSRVGAVVVLFLSSACVSRRARRHNGRRPPRSAARRAARRQDEMPDDRGRPDPHGGPPERHQGALHRWSSPHTSPSAHPSTSTPTGGSYGRVHGAPMFPGTTHSPLRRLSRIAPSVCRHSSPTPHGVLEPQESEGLL